MSFTFLIVQRDSGDAQRVQRVLRSFGAAAAFDTIGSARGAFLNDRFSALVIDTDLADGRGLDLLRDFRRQHRFVPALVLTSSNTREDINRAFELRAHYLVAPATFEQLTLFAESVAAAAQDLASYAAQKWASAYALSPAEVDVLVGAAEGDDRSSLAKRRGTSPFTIKWHISSLLRKTGDSNLRAAANRLLREATQK
jgi:DNA-binding NarL/FixJ family response regulator